MLTNFQLSVWLHPYLYLKENFHCHNYFCNNNNNNNTCNNDDDDDDDDDDNNNNNSSNANDNSKCYLTFNQGDLSAKKLLISIRALQKKSKQPKNSHQLNV